MDNKLTANAARKAVYRLTPSRLICVRYLLMLNVNELICIKAPLSRHSNKPFHDLWLDGRCP